jgi:lipopolysaccharide biosynthesis glycosyltransferase
MLTMFVGYDPREAAAYHVFCQSVIAHASVPVAFVPMSEKMLHVDGQQDGSNAFIYSRYLVPHLMGHWDWAIFADGDMVCQRDIAELWALRDPQYAVQVVKHEYQTKDRLKYRGSPMESPNMSYPRKNWSSLVLWNCGHPANRALTPETVATAGGQYLHRFAWLPDDQIGELPREWNWLVGEYPPQPAALLHYTLGVPGFKYYAQWEQAQPWHDALIDTLHIYGENGINVLARAYGRSDLA